MTVLTVKAQDTATAMEEIAEKLGKDSFIIGTKKIGDEILVKATNSPKKTAHSKKNLNKTFNRIISKELNQSSVSSLGNNPHYGIDDKEETFSINNFSKETINNFAYSVVFLNSKGIAITTIDKFYDGAIEPRKAGRSFIYIDDFVRKNFKSTSVYLKK